VTDAAGVIVPVRERVQLAEHRPAVAGLADDERVQLAARRPDSATRFSR
jgi:hypothetical protein